MNYRDYDFLKPRGTQLILNYYFKNPIRFLSYSYKKKKAGYFIGYIAYWIWLFSALGPKALFVELPYPYGISIDE